MNRRELVVARHNLTQSRQMIAKRLVSIYTTTQPSTLDLLLGSRNLSDLMTRLDNVDRLSSLDRQVIGQVVTFKGDVLRHARQLKNERAYADRPASPSAGPSAPRSPRTWRSASAC